MLIKTTVPDDHTKERLQNLVQTCCRHDNQLLSYPLEDADSHYLFYTEDGLLVSAAAMTILGGGVTECSAFTLPAYRRQGFFSYLLEQALADYGESEILFACEPDCTDTIAVLEHLEAEPGMNEYQMEYVCYPPPDCPAPKHTGLSLVPNRQTDDTVHWQLFHCGSQIGSCFTVRISESRVCLYQVLIREDQRRQGFARDLLSLLITRLSEQAVSSIILQVSGNNPGALALYTKTGFRITRTLSYYYY